MFFFLSEGSLPTFQVDGDSICVGPFYILCGAATAARSKCCMEDCEECEEGESSRVY